MANPIVAQSRTAATQYDAAKRAKISLAQQSPHYFNRYVLRDEKTGGLIDPAPMHDEWQTIISRDKRVVLWSHVESGKTNQITIGRTLYEIGHNHNLIVAVVSSTDRPAMKIGSSIAQYIEKSPELHEVFPDLMRSRNKAMPWNKTQLTIERSVLAKDPTIELTGYRGNVIGARIDLLIFDDILNQHNTATQASRDEVFDWIQTTFFGRLSDEARVWCLGNAWHPKDAMHKLEALTVFNGYRFPVLDPKTNQTTWPRRWPNRRIAEWRQQNGIFAYNKQLLCKGQADEDATFKQDWINVALKRGNGFKPVDRLDRTPNGCAVFHGVDLASRQNKRSDYTALASILVYPQGHRAGSFARQLLKIRAGKWTGPDIVRQIKLVDELYGGLFIVENVAAQQYILDFATELTSALVIPFTTGNNKADPRFGVQSIAAEMESGRWIIPNDNGAADQEIDLLLKEEIDYDPNEHTGDRLMAKWFAREGARAWERRMLGNVNEDGSFAPQVEGLGMRVFG